MNSAFQGQRRYVRVAWRLPVRVGTSLYAEPFDATTFNISAGGLCLLPSRPLPQGTPVTLELGLPQGLRERRLRLTASVVREVSISGGATLSAIAFDEMSTRDRQILRESIVQRALAQVQSLTEYQAFRNLSDLDLIELASVTHELQLFPGDHVAHFGDEATSVFLVKRGAVELRAPVDLDYEDVRVDVARAGQVFGEVSTLLGLPHNLDIIAIEDTDLLVIPRTALGFLREHNPQLALMLYEIFAAFMGRRLRRMTGRLVSPLSY
jgi:hypothetical protein